MSAGHKTQLIICFRLEGSNYQGVQKDIMKET